MKAIIASFFCSLVLLGSQVTFAQRTPGALGPPPADPNNPPPEWMRKMEENRKALDKLNGKDERGMIANRAVTKKTTPVRANGKPYTKEELEMIRALSEPKPEDLITYKDFLKQPHTGIFRIFPDIECQSKFVLQVDGDCENNFYGLKSYSFRKNTYFPEDIKFRDGIFIADNFFSQEILVNLGNVNFNDVSLTASGMKFLNDFAAPVSMDEARKQYARIAGGVEADGYKYANKLKAETDTVYGLRLITYRIGNDVYVSLSKDYRRKIVVPEKQKFMGVKDDNKNRADQIIAFRIVRKDEDGSITVIWKELKHQEAPKLTFKKDETYADIKN